MGLEFAERKKIILDILNAENKVEVVKLAGKLEVSEVTIRRDLSIMEGQGLLAKTYGGAVKLEQTLLETMYRDKAKKCLKKKKQLANMRQGLLKKEM